MPTVLDSIIKSAGEYRDSYEEIAAASDGGVDEAMLASGSDSGSNAAGRGS